MKTQHIASAIILTLFALAAACYMTGCAGMRVSGSLEYPLPTGGTARLTSDGKTTNIAIQLPADYAK